MNKSLAILIILVTQGLLLFAQHTGNVDYNKTLNLFRKFENKVELIREKYIREQIFISPADKAVIFEDALKKETPDLADKTKLYSKYLVEILQNKEIPRGKEFNLDIIRALYHLCIDDYANALNEIYKGFQNNTVNVEIFEYAIMTFEGHYSNAVLENYNFPKLQVLWQEILRDSNLINRVEKKDSLFSQTIRGIQSGEYNRDFDQDQKGWFFVIPVKKCR